MINTFLDISQSNYIFSQQITIAAIIFALCIGLIVLFTYRIAKAKGNDLHIRSTISRNLLYIILVLIVYFLLFFPLWKDAIALRSRGVETFGTTIKWIDLGDGERNIVYEFEIDGQKYSGQSETIYGGRMINDIICPNGIYVVIFDPKDPGNSVMDFKRRY